MVEKNKVQKQKRKKKKNQRLKTNSKKKITQTIRKYYNKKIYGDKKDVR